MEFTDLSLWSLSHLSLSTSGPFIPSSDDFLWTVLAGVFFFYKSIRFFHQCLSYKVWIHISEHILEFLIVFNLIHP